MKRRIQRSPWKAVKKRVPKSHMKKQVARLSAKEFLAKSDAFQEKLTRVANAVSKMRAEKVSLTQASRDSGINPRTVIRWAVTALKKRKSGKYVAKPKDNLPRILKIPGSQGTRDIALRGSEQPSLLGQYWNAVHRYLQTGDASQLRKFRGKRITDASGKKHSLLTELAELDRQGNAGVLSFETIYARTK